MSVLSITPILHNGESYPVGTDVTKLEGITEDGIRAMLEGGSAVEIGTRKYSDKPSTEVPVGMEESVKREELLAKANGGNEVPPSTTAGDPVAAAGKPGGDPSDK